MSKSQIADIKEGQIEQGINFLLYISHQQRSKAEIEGFCCLRQTLENNWGFDFMILTCHSRLDYNNFRV